MALLVVGLWVVVMLAVLVAPLVKDEPVPLADQYSWILTSEMRGDRQSVDGAETGTARSDDPRAMTDGGHRCHVCGAPIDETYTYCGECLTPKLGQ